MSDKGTDKLIQRIIDEAQAEAQKIDADATAKIETMRKASAERIAALKADGEAKSSREETDIIFRARKNAELDAKKNDLCGRHVVIDEAFAAALSKLLAMTTDESAELMRKIMFREVSGGETIRPSKRHYDVVASVIPQINNMLIKENTQTIALGEVCDIDNGFIIVGNGFTKTCSFEALLDDVREREIGKIADILF